MTGDVETLRQRAIALLTRREHSEKELFHKLGSRGFSHDDISKLLIQLKQEGLQSDQRFTDAYIHQRLQRGYGPVRISQELREKGISGDLIEALLFAGEVDWAAQLLEVREKKFGKSMPDSYKEQARQSRFLQYRGFPSEQIRQLFKSVDA